MNFYEHQSPHQSVQVLSLSRVTLPHMGIFWARGWGGGTLQLNFTFSVPLLHLPCICGTKKILHQLLKTREHGVSELFQFTSDFQRTTWCISSQSLLSKQTKGLADSLLFTFSISKVGCEGQLPMHPSSTPPSIYPSSIFPSTHSGRGDTVSEVEKQWK